MADHDHDDVLRDVDGRTTDHPLGGTPRSTIVPLVITVLALAAIVGVFVLITFVADYRSTTG